MEKTMPHYPYLIIGGGMAAAAAVEGIREADGEKEIAIISSDSQKLYDRPPLSNALAKGDKAVDDVFRPLSDKVTFHGWRTITKLEAKEHRATDDLGTTYTYDKLLLAPGATPRHLPIGGDNIIYYRTLDTYRLLRGVADKHDNFAVI